MSVIVFTTLWIALLIGVLVVEFAAIVNKDYGDTLSEHVWRLMTTIAGSFVLISLWFWLTWHFFIEPRFFTELWLDVWTDDYIVVGAGLLAAIFLRRKK